MTDFPQDKILATVGQLSAVLRSLHAFNTQEVLPVVKGLLAPTEREQCFIATYYRAAANVGTALTLNDSSHFQAIAMLARSNIELAMDMKLLNVVPRAVEKMVAFGQSEKLKAAKKILEFARGSDKPIDVSIYEQFVAMRENEVVALRQALWGFPQPPNHWANMTIRERAVTLGAPFDELYELKYRHLSWQAHAGLAGVLGLDRTVFLAMCGESFGIAARCYEEVLTATIVELRLGKADGTIWDKLRYARLLPTTEGPAQRAQLERELFG